MFIYTNISLCYFVYDNFTMHQYALSASNRIRYN